MENIEFIVYPKIEQMGKLHMTITQKLHGTNAQILVREGRSEAQWAINAGSRTRWLTPEDDNHGFCKWVYENKDQLIEKLGEGRHYGEWAGKGINAGEGLPNKKFFLFNWRRYQQKELPENVDTVPVLYTGKFDLEKINEVFQDLKTNGSRAFPGYMKPEGIVVEIDRKLYKKVFAVEEVAWCGKKGEREARISAFDASPYLHPLRLEKLLSRDEKYTREYPESLPQIAKDYIQDLVDEKQIPGTDEEIEVTRKTMSRAVFNFVKETFGQTN